jgi:hypothetical protein
MIRDFCLRISLALLPLAARAANKPHAAAESQTIKVWTNDDLEKLRTAGRISIIGPLNQEKPASESAPQRYEATQNPHWYAEQASGLRDELECRQLQLREYRKKLENAQVSGKQPAE